MEKFAAATTPRPERSAQIVADLVCHRFEENPLVAISVEVELQRFEFDALLVRDVMHGNRSEIRVPRDRAHRGEFVMGVRDLVIAVRRGIRERFENFRISHEF